MDSNQTIVMKSNASHRFFAIVAGRVSRTNNYGIKTFLIVSLLLSQFSFRTNVSDVNSTGKLMETHDVIEPGSPIINTLHGTAVSDGSVEKERHSSGFLRHPSINKTYAPGKRSGEMYRIML